MSNNRQWKLIPHSYPIADTGDYDGYYELTDGTISIMTKDDVWDEGSEEEKQLCGLLGTFKWYQDDSHIAIIDYLERWKGEMYKFLEHKGLTEEYQQWSMDKAQKI